MGIAWAAKKLGADKGHLWRVIHGHQNNPGLLERFHEICPGRAPYIPGKTRSIDQVRDPNLVTGEDAVRTLLDSACAELNRALHRRQLYQSLQADFHGLRSFAAAIDLQVPRNVPAFSVPQFHDVVRSVAEEHERGLRMMLLNAAEILRLVNPACAADLDKQIQEDGGNATLDLALEFLRRELQNLCQKSPPPKSTVAAVPPKKPSRVPKTQ